MERKVNRSVFFLIALIGFASISDAQTDVSRPTAGCTTTANGIIICPTPAPSSVEFRNDDLVALNAFLKTNIYKKGPYEKNADYEAKIEGLVGQKIAGSLTGKSLWTYYQRLGAIQYATTKFDPDLELAEISFWDDFDTELIEPSRDDFRAGKIPTSYDALTGYHTQISHLYFLGDYSNLAGLNSTDIIKRVKFRVSPEEARAIGFGDSKSKNSMPVMLRITFVPESPYRARYVGSIGSPAGDRIYGQVQSLSVVNSKTGKVYFETAQPKPISAATTGYSKFLGVWAYSDRFNQKYYFRIVSNNLGRFQLTEGVLYEGDILWGADSTPLSQSNGALQGSYSRSSRIRLEFQPNGKVFVMRSLRGRAEKYYATRNADK